MTSQEFIPELSIKRRVLDIPSNFLVEMQAELDGIPDVNQDDVQLQLRASSYVSLVREGEIQRLFKIAGEQPSREAIIALDHYLNDNLPDEFHETLPIKLRPLSEVNLELPGKAFGRDDDVDFCGFRSPTHRHLYHDVEVSRAIVCDYFGLVPGGKIARTAWKNNNAGRVLVAGVIGNENIEPVRKMYERSKLLPNQVTLGKVSISTKVDPPR